MRASGGRTCGRAGASGPDVGAWRSCACAGAEASGVGGLGSSGQRLRPDRRETCGAVAGGEPGGAPAGGGAQTGGDLLAAETPSRTHTAGRRDAEPARESAGRRGRRRPEGRAAAGGEPAALEAEAPSAESPRGRWGLRLRLRAWDWVTGSRGLGDRGG